MTKIQGSGLEKLVGELRTHTTQQEDQITQLNSQIMELEAESAQKPNIIDTEEYQQLLSG